MRGGLWCALLASGAFACRSASSSPGNACELAAAAHDSDAPRVCLTLFALTGDAHDAGRAALELARDDKHDADITALAHAIGDAPGGADAWDAVGTMHFNAAEWLAATSAYARAYNHRARADIVGQLRDIRGLYRSLFQDEHLGLTFQAAAIGFALAQQPVDDRMRVSVLAGVAALLVDTGDLPACQVVLSQADAILDPSAPPAPGTESWMLGRPDDTIRAWITLREVHGEVDRKLDRYELARQEFLLAGAVARDNRMYDRSRAIAFHLADLEVNAGKFDAAAATLAAAPHLAVDTTESRLTTTYLEAQIALGRGRIKEALEILEAPAPARAPPASLRWIAGLRGRAYLQDHRGAEAEQSLLGAIAARETTAEDLDLDSLKGWILERERQPFEDLFHLYVTQQRVDEALLLVQRSTARAIFDGLSPHDQRSDLSIGDAIEADGARADGLRELAHSMRSSPAARPLGSDELRARLAGDDVLTYFRADNELWLIAVTSAGTSAARRIGNANDLDALARAWAAAPGREDLATDLGTKLLPADLLPPRGAILHIILDDPIRDVQFAALRVEGDYLVRRNPVSYAPSAAVIAALTALPARTGPAIVVGDPLGDLPDARKEAADVGALLDTRARIGGDATVAALVGARGARLLHVAAHTRTSEKGPALQLVDGAVTASDVIEQTIAPDVVVLTSCVSADPTDHDQLGPLASAFLAAGARSVVASRSVLDDNLARRFAHAFYAAGGARDPVTATAIAQRQLADAGVPVESWDAFVVLGGVVPPNVAMEEKR